MKRPPLSEDEVSFLTKQEYDHLLATYSALVKSFTLLEGNRLKSVTMEGDEFQFRVTSEGWKVTEGGQRSDQERTWEMVEDLLRSISPAFKKGWDMMLMEKLQLLAETQESSETTPISSLNDLD